MGFLTWFRKAISPAKVEQRARVVGTKPLWEQFQRIGGGIGPTEVSAIMQEADAGQPARLIDLGNECRQKDGHNQSISGTRDRAVALCEVAFVETRGKGGKSKPRDQKSIDLCRRIVDEFDNWPTLVEHLTAAWFPGHATAELLWHRTKDGLLLPYKCVPIHPRDFIFSVSDGSLRYSRGYGDMVGVDILADNPGRIIQIQRRIVGDVQVREGLIRLLIWSSLFRNWTLKDWIALGEIGWKPWRIGKYDKDASKDDIDQLVDLLERIGSTGAGAIPETTDLQIEWPKGMAPGTGGSGTHGELFAVLGREMSKAVLGQTTSVEPGANGDRASTQTRDEIRKDIRESDAIADAAVLRAHLFGPAIALNRPQGSNVPVPWFQTDESVDQLTFASAVEKLQKAGCRIPTKWVRDEVGMPEPIEGEEMLEPLAPKADEGDDDGPEDPDDDEGDDEKAGAKKAA